MQKEKAGYFARTMGEGLEQQQFFAHFLVALFSSHFRTKVGEAVRDRNFKHVKDLMNHQLLEKFTHLYDAEY